MTDHDEIDRLARANPAPPGSLAGAARSGAGLAARESIMRTLTPARPRRARRLIGPLVGALGALALVALIAALIGVAIIAKALSSRKNALSGNILSRKKAWRADDCKARTATRRTAPSKSPSK